MSLKSLAFAGFVVGLAACATLAPRPEFTKASLTPTDAVWFTGSSNLNAFTCRATLVAVSAEAAPEETARTRTDGLPTVKSAALAIPVRSLDCGISRMNADLLHALRGDRHSTISFRMTDYVVSEGTEQRPVRLMGLLTIAGATRVLALDGSLFRGTDGQIRLRGQRTINVRDYGIAPPRKLIGLLRVRHEITVRFDVAVRPLIDPLAILASSLR